MLVTATARLKYLSIPPRKMRLVANMVKGMPVEDALNILNFTPKIAAHHLAKTVKSAAANALSIEGTDNLHPEDLVIKDVAVDNAPTAKRIRFQSMGRIFRIRKRYCHLMVKLETEIEPQKTKKPSTQKTRKVDNVKADVVGSEKTSSEKASSKKATKSKASSGNKVTDRSSTKKESVVKTEESPDAKKDNSDNKSAEE
ncbi:MAG: 50S ribosomal protein L22 [candidate division Zixibacteria bacterium]|nr:50S ribosomal protein L22 [candidate division Zixibacteria bacterium]